MKKIFLIAALLFSTIAQAQFPLEPLYGHFKTNGGVAIQVYSGGCTSKDSFTVYKKQNNDVSEIYFIRKTPDYCKAYMKYGRLLYFTYENMGLQRGEKYMLMNPSLSTHIAW